jgi:hypothetical protein
MEIKKKCYPQANFVSNKKLLSLIQISFRMSNETMNINLDRKEYFFFLCMYIEKNNSILSEK